MGRRRGGGEAKRGEEGGGRKQKGGGEDRTAREGRRRKQDGRKRPLNMIRY